MSLWSWIVDRLGRGRAHQNLNRSSAAESPQAQPEDVSSAPVATVEEAAAPAALAAEDALPETVAESRSEVESPASALPAPRKVAQEEALTVILEGPEEEILWSIGRRIEAGKLELPTLPSASMAVIELANHPSVEFRQIVDQISMDPVLSSELLRTSNSVLYAGVEPVDTLQTAVARIGLRALRSMIFSISMRGTILRSGPLAQYAEEVWRQAYSLASIAREIAPLIGVDPEKAFLLGLLQDVGKIPLLSILSKEVKDPAAISPGLVDQVFQTFHQEAGAAMARKWKLPAEFASVAGCHHDWASNVKHTRSAALANAVYRIEAALSAGDAELLLRMRELPSLVFLAPQAETRARILEQVETAYRSSAPAPASAPAGSSSSSSSGALPAS